MYEDLRCLNRGYGMAMAALDRLQRPKIFPRACLADYRNRTDALRALANRDLLGLLAGPKARTPNALAASPQNANAHPDRYSQTSILANQGATPREARLQQQLGKLIPF